MKLPFSPSQKEDASSFSREKKLEELTIKYLLGEIDHDDFKKEVKKLKTNFDLRKIASILPLR